MKKTFFTALFAVAGLAAQAQVEITVDMNDRGINISPTHYGIFYEDINHSADGGLYAELIRNRSFEEFTQQRMPEPEQGEPAGGDMPPRQPRQVSPQIQSWSTVGTAALSLTQENLLNEKQGNALVVDVKQAGDGVQNEGYWGINVENGKTYTLNFWVKVNSGKPGTLTAKLVSQKGETLAEAQITDKLSGKWQKVSTTMLATGNDPKAHFELTAGKTCQLALDVVSLFPPTYKNRENGCREQLVEMLEALHPKFVRFPGGCYVEGHTTPESAFRWERTVGPIEERPGHQGVNWGYWISDGMGFHEFLQLCEDLGAEPLYVVNVGIWHGGFTPVEELDTTWIPECMDALEYANGDQSTKYGALRAKNGHPEPFNLKYLEIGNENANFFFDNNKDQSERYFERYAKFRDAVKAKYPNMVCIGNVESWGTDHPSWRSDEQVDVLDEHYYRNPSWFMKAYDKYDSYDRNGPKVYAGEWAVTSQFGKVGNMNAALGESVYMMGMENNSDVVIMNSYAPLFVNENAFNWPTDLIHFDSQNAFGTPSYWAQYLFTNHLGNRLMNQETIWSLPEADLPSMEGKSIQIGVSSWGTQASFKDPELIIDGVSVDLGNITEWQTLPTTPAQREGGPRRIRARQDWSVDKGEGVVTNLGNSEGRKWMCPKEFTASKYTYKVKARKESGAEGFLAVYNYQNDRDFDWFNIGGWGNSNNAIEQSVDGGRVTLTGDCPFKVEDGRWYDLQVDVEGDSVAAYIDGKLQFTARHQNADMRGIFSNSTLDEATNTLYVKVINVGGESTNGTVNIQNGTAASAEMIRLATDSGQDENSIDHPLNVIPRPANVDLAQGGKRLTFEVAPYSISVITVKMK